MMRCGGLGAARALCLVSVMGCAGAAHGYRVLVHVGHAFTAEELVKPEGWTEAAARADGVWLFDAWIRTLGLTEDQDAVTSNVKSRAFCMAEFPWCPPFTGENRQQPNPVLAAAERAGFEQVWCMVYDEARYGSTLSADQVAECQRLFPERKLITNVRVFLADRFEKELNALDGISYEFNLPGYRETSVHHPSQTKLENVVESIRWCLDRDKTVFLLLPPGDDGPSEEGRYVRAMMDFLRDLDALLEDGYLGSDRLVFVPATYDCRKRHVHNVPELEPGAYANTGMGAVLAALDYRDTKGFPRADGFQ